MKGLKSWWNTRNYKIGERLSEDQLQELFRAVHFQRKWTSRFHALWSLLIGICTIIAALFSVLAYFK